MWEISDFSFKYCIFLATLTAWTSLRTCLLDNYSWEEQLKVCHAWAWQVAMILILGKLHHLSLIREIPQCYTLPGCCHCSRSWFLHLKQTSVISSNIHYAAVSPCIFSAHDIFLVTSFLMFSVLCSSLSALLSQLLLFNCYDSITSEYFMTEYFGKWENTLWLLRPQKSWPVLPVMEHRRLRRNLRKNIFISLSSDKINFGAIET